MRDIIDFKKDVHPRRCENCWHYDPPNKALRQDVGSCVANFPGAVMMPTQNGPVTITVFPQMKPEQRCSKWESTERPPVVNPLTPLGYDPNNAGPG